MADHNLNNIDLSEYPHINRGLDGIVAFSTNESFIDGQSGDLIYAGYHIDTLAEHATFEEVCFLLWNDRLPNETELNELKSELIKNRKISKPVIWHIKKTNKADEQQDINRRV